MINAYLSDQLSLFPNVIDIIIQRKETLITESKRVFGKGHVGKVVGMDMFGIPTMVYPFITMKGQTNFNMFVDMYGNDNFKRSYHWLAAKQAEHLRIENGELSLFDWLKGLIIISHSESVYRPELNCYVMVFETKTIDKWKTSGETMSSRETVTIMYNKEINVEQNSVTEKGKEEFSSNKPKQNGVLELI